MSEIDKNRYQKRVEELLASFRKGLLNEVDKAFSNFYQDAMHWAVIDGEINYANFLRDRLTEDLRKEVLGADDTSIYSWASNFRLELLKQHREELQSALITQLQATIKSRDEHILEQQEMLRRSYR